MPNQEKNARALIYWAKMQPRWRDNRYAIQQLKDGIREVAERPEVGPPLRTYGSDNHRFAQVVPWCLHTGDWSLMAEALTDLKRKGLSELGPLYPMLTLFALEVTIEEAPEDVADEAAKLLGLFEGVFDECSILYPSRLELLCGDKTFGHDRTFQKVGSWYVPTFGPRAIFGPGLGWQLENPLSQWWQGETTPRTEQCRTAPLDFAPRDWCWPAGAAFNVDPVGGFSFGGYWMRWTLDVVKFTDDSKLIVCSKDAHNTKPPILVVDAQAEGVCRYLCPVKYKSHRHTKGSVGRVEVRGSKVLGIAENAQEGRTLESRERPLSSVASWRRLTKEHGWQDIDPTTQEPGDTEPPTQPPTEPPTEPPSDDTPLGYDKFDAMLQARDAGNAERELRFYREWLEKIR